ncbi:MAG: hypothetical protein OXU20_18840 [Myxococcales bacterium]|nr:hypothetical protein [Myxococcales bacterium]
MRTRCACGVVVLGCLLVVADVRAQSALKAAKPDAQRLADSALTLRPAFGLEHLAEDAARVLELRTGMPVRVGKRPPADLSDGVPPGHVALLPDDQGVHLVLGVRDREAYETGVRLDLDAPIVDDEHARSVALAVEALRDLAFEQRRARLEREPPDTADVPSEPLPEPVVVMDATAEEPAPVPVPAKDEGFADVGPLDDTGLPRARGGFLAAVEPLVFAHAYGGASSASSAPQIGIAAGAGLCAVGHCVVLASAIPMTRGAPEDVRYRYITFSSTLHSRPFEFAGFTPGLAAGFVTRVGRFNADMGLEDSGVQTDLAARFHAELAYRVLPFVELTAEGGIDYGLDAWRVSDDHDSVSRGDRTAPWVQAGVRMQP